MTARCSTCRGPLDEVATICNESTCTSCEVKSIEAAIREGAAPGREWAVFVAAVKASARPDGTVHQGDVRPKIRGRIEPKHIGTLYRRARAEGLLVDTGEREPSNDTAGRNADKLSRIYRLAGQRVAA